MDLRRVTAAPQAPLRGQVTGGAHWWTPAGVSAGNRLDSKEVVPTDVARRRYAISFCQLESPVRLPDGGLENHRAIRRWSVRGRARVQPAWWPHTHAL